MSTIAKILLGAGLALGSTAGLGALKRVAAGVQGSRLDKAVDAVVTQWAAGAGSNLVKATQSVRVEPYCLVDVRAAQQPEIKDVMIAAQRLYTSYYLTAVAAENTVGSVKVSRFLDKFAPDRDLSQATQNFISTGYSSESYQFGLPFAGQAQGVERYAEYCSEASNPVDPKAVKKGGASFGNGTTKTITDITNLSIGQIVDVTITNGEQKGVIPVSIRLRTVGMDTSLMHEVLALGARNNGNLSRLTQWRVGDKTLLGDLIMNQDRIDAYRRAAMADTSGYFRNIHKRADRGLLAHLLSGQPSLGTVSSIVVTTIDTIREVEHETGARFDDFEDRQKIFEDSLLMLLFVIDPDHETVRVYTRDIEESGVYPLRDLKNQNSNGNTDLTEIMRSYLEGKVPGRL